MDSSKLIEYLLIWVLLVGTVAFTRARHNTPGAGLTLAYLLNLSLIHFVGAAIYAFPAFENQDLRFTELGFEQSLYGVIGFTFGVIIITTLLHRSGSRRRFGHSSAVIAEPDPRLPKAYLACGIVSFFLLSTFLGRVPTAMSIVSAGQQLVVAGICLGCWKAWRDHNLRHLAMWLTLALLLPLGTLILQGYLGYGTIALLVVLIFLSSLVRSPFKVALVALPLLYLGLSVFVSYMRDRSEIRAAVWGGEALSDRAESLMGTVTRFEWFDPTNTEHLGRIDGRLNQNFLVGAAVARLSAMDGYARGETLWDALLALIPRAFWAEKPISAGSGKLVTRFTGIEYDSSTSVGVGQVLEFYANFGTTGVVVGFVVMGIIIAFLDWQAGMCLGRGDMQGFVLWFLPGISFLQVGGQLVEITAGAAASLVVALLVNRYLGRLRKSPIAGSRQLACTATQR